MATVSPNTIQEFPAEYLQALDEVLTLGAFSAKYDVAGAEFVSSRTVKVPKLTFDGGADEYDRFSKEGEMKLEYETLELSADKQKVFYVDAVEDADTATVMSAQGMAEWERQYFIDELDEEFFDAAIENAGTTGSATLTSTNIKDELRKARVELVNHGAAAADLYMTPDALAALEDAIDRNFAGEGAITDTVGKYNIFTVYLVPEARLAGADFVAIAPGAIRNIRKRTATYFFAPGQHQKGDGYLMQNRWVYGAVVNENKKSLIYANVAASGTNTTSTTSVAAKTTKATS